MIQYLDKANLDTFANDVLKETYPGYNGKKFKLEVRATVQLSGAYWDGGSKSEYRLYNTDKKQAVSIPDAPFLRQSELHESIIDLPANYILVEHRIFQGKDMGITFIVSPLANTNLLQGDKQELTKDERIVLVATRSLKSSYAGISNYRYHEANSRTGITLENWNTAKQILINKDLLTKAGAITNKGKNAIDGIWDFHSIE